MKKTEEALLKSEDLLNKTGEMAKVGAWEIDLNTNSVYWSHGTKLIHEVPPDFETNLENAVDYYLGEAQEVITRAVNDAIEYGKIFDLELDFKTAKGNYRCVRAIGYSDFSESICTRVYGTFMDITSQKQAEQKLVESEAMFKNFFELATVGNIQGSPDGKILRVNKKFCEITGYTADELFKKTVLEITHPEDLSLDQGYINRVISGEIDSYTIEKRYIHKNGKVVWVELYSNVHRDETGEVIYAIGSIVDITDRKKSQEDLHKAKTFLENTIKQSPFAMWISDKNGNIIKTNPALCKFINLTNEQIIGKYNVLKDENLKKQGVMEKVKNVFHKKASASFSIPWKAMDAGTDEMSTANNMHINVSMFPISNSNNELEHVVCQWIDITEEKNAEEALKKASHEKELLLKEVHHRIKNNMNTLKSLLFIQAEKIKNPEAKEALQAAETRISSMLVLYNQLYKKENIESVSLLNYISELIQILTSTQSSTVEIKQEIEDIEISSKIIFPLGIIVNELITNAIKYAFEEKNESNTITVTTRVIEDECTLTVKDNGKGISLDDTPRGFGLELVDMLTQQLDGTLSITNDQGTKVEITFSLDRISMYA